MITVAETAEGKTLDAVASGRNRGKGTHRLHLGTNVLDIIVLVGWVDSTLLQGIEHGFGLSALERPLAIHPRHAAAMVRQKGWITAPLKSAKSKR